MRPLRPWQKNDDTDEKHVRPFKSDLFNCTFTWHQTKKLMVFSTFTCKNSLKMKVEIFVELETLVTSWKEGVYHIVELYLQQLCPPPLPRPLIRHQRDKTKCPLYRAVCFNYWSKVMCIKLDFFKLYMCNRENCCVHLHMAKSLCNNSQQHATTL